MKKHILLIDDDEDELGIFMDALDGVGDFFKCTYAANAEQGAEILQYTHPDYIFVDYNLPRVNGLEFISVAKESVKPDITKVFLYSTNISDEAIKMARLLGASGCIEKSTTIKELTRRLKIILDPGPDLSYDFFHGEKSNGK